jgi:lipopolysaccharide transport system permease protein
MQLIKQKKNSPQEDYFLRLQPSKGWIGPKFKEFWEFRELLYFLIWRDIKVKYKQTILGAAWAILQPLITMVIFSIIFGRLAGVPSDGVDYPVFSFVALVPWTFFAGGVSLGANTLVSNPEMIRKIYFPRLTMPTSAVLSGLVDFSIAFVTLIFLLYFFGFSPTINIIWLPLFLIQAIMSALGTTYWLSALNVQFRDVRYIVPFLIQIWLFITPVAYSSSLISAPWQLVYAINPMAGVIEGFRWAILDTPSSSIQLMFISFLSASILLLSGILYFRRMEKSFADII